MQEIDKVKPNLTSLHNFIQPFLYKILSTGFLSHPEFMQIYSAVYTITSTPHRQELLTLVQGDIYAFLLTIPDDHQTFLKFVYSSKLLNKALRHLSIATQRTSPRLQVYQICLRSWINAGKPCYPEPGEEDVEYMDNLTDLLGSVTIL